MGGVEAGEEINDMIWNIPMVTGMSPPPLHQRVEVPCVLGRHDCTCAPAWTRTSSPSQGALCGMRNREDYAMWGITLGTSRAHSPKHFVSSRCIISLANGM